MRAASRLEEAEDKLSESLVAAVPPVNQSCSLLIGCIPVFWQNFMIDIRNPQTRQVVSEFYVGQRNHADVRYNFNGLQRQLVLNEDSVVQVHRDGMIVLHKRLPIVREGGVAGIRPIGIDIILRTFVGRSSNVYAAAAISGPFLLTMLLHAANNITGLYPMPGAPGADEPGEMISLGTYPFPVLQADNFLDVDKSIRPLCDQAHQMFGRDASPCFNPDGAWNR